MQAGGGIEEEKKFFPRQHVYIQQVLACPVKSVFLFHGDFLGLTVRADPESSARR